MAEFLLFARAHAGYSFEQTLDLFLAEVGGRVGTKPWQLQHAPDAIRIYGYQFRGAKARDGDSQKAQAFVDDAARPERLREVIRQRPSLAGLSRHSRRRRRAQLESGEYASLEDLARDVGCDRTYVGRMLRLTSLAPDIIEAILRGQEPDGLSLEKLRKNLPVRWDEQRKAWR
ncbi:MAG: hypothetical protein GVY36_19325 [Verrucomicrobia bacterium]|nr:hypothetical protein [Verrucomicrobiota bacterium]